MGNKAADLNREAIKALDDYILVLQSAIGINNKGISSRNKENQLRAAKHGKWLVKCMNNAIEMRRKWLDESRS